ncbi:hypothetical protein Tco_0608955 [Tanacetum coccineum]
MGLWYSKDFRFELIAYSDADHAGCKDDCKSTSGGLQFLGEKLLSWSSKKQDCTAMSTAEAEYVSLFACCAQVIWMHTQLLNYGYKYNQIPMHCNSKSAIAISYNPVQHSRTKHIDISNAASSSGVFGFISGTFWHTLKEDGSNYRLKFILDRKELTLTLDDFRTIFHLPQANDNNHDQFVPPPKFSEMVPFYKNELGFTLELKTSSSFKTTGLMRARDKYHNLDDDETMKNIFNLGRHKDRVEMKIPSWMITDELKLTEHYRMYVEVFGIDVPLTQSQPTESTQGIHRTPSASRPPNPEIDAGESIPTVDEADDMILQDTLQVSLAEHKSREELIAQQNVKLVKKHLASEEIEKLVEGTENVEEYSSIPKNDDDQNIPSTRLEPKSDKESPEEMMVTDPTPSSSTPSSCSPNPNISTTNRLLSLLLKAKPGRFKCYKSFFHELQGHYGYLFEHLKTRFMPRRKFDNLASHLKYVMFEALPKMLDDHIQEQMAKMIAEAMHQERENLRADISSQIQNAITNHIPSQVDASVRSYMSGHILHVHPTQAALISAVAQKQQYQLYLTMRNNPQLQQDDIAIWIALKIKFERLQVPDTSCRPSAIRPRDQDDPHDDAHPEGEKDDDEIPTKQVSQEVMDEMMETIDEAKLRKVADEMLRQRFSPHRRKTTPVVQSCQKDPKAPALSLMNHDLLYLKKEAHDLRRLCCPCTSSLLLIFLMMILKKELPDRYLTNLETGLFVDIVSLIRSTVIPGKSPAFILVYGIIYKNNKKEKRVMRHSEIHKFCDATLKRVLVGLKSYNNDMKYGYAKTNLTKEDAEYLQLFEE